MSYKSLFDHPQDAARLPASGGAGDLRTGSAYQFTAEMELALSAAAATQRPLLVTGPAGCGKSSLARAAARRLNWRYLERSIHSRTEIHSLLWEIDSLKRLQDAHGGTLDEDILAYVRASVLWQALDPQTAADPRLLRADDLAAAARLDPAVVLIDEIDKADPDLPNNLLEVLGTLRFEVADSGRRVACRAGIPLIVITSNDERDLPPAFVRRCIVLGLKQPDLKRVATLHYPDDGATIDAAHDLLTRDAALQPSAAEFIDFIQACKTLQVRPGSDAWLGLAQACVTKGRAAGIGGAARA